MRAAFLICLLLPFHSQSQDSLYARKVITELCSEKYFGRGYVREGLAKAESYLVAELSRIGAVPLLPTGYTQSFTHPVNTFPGKCKVKLNGKTLQPGTDYILDPASKGLNCNYKLERRDSVTYTDESGELLLELKKKLTFSVAGKVSELCIVQLDRNRVTDIPRRIKVRLRNKFVTQFESRNVLACINGTQNNDTMILFTAHYDHLGGLGRKAYFPGANDNASGVSMVLNLARHYAVNKPKYRTVFIFFAAEEAGLLGSAHLVKSKALDLGKIRFMVNLDLLGTGDDGIMVVNGAVHEDQFARLQQLNDRTKLVKEIRKRGKAANSDHYHFSEAGVPAFFIYTLGGTTAYHDVADIESSLPLTDYVDVMELIRQFAAGF